MSFENRLAAILKRRAMLGSSEENTDAGELSLIRFRGHFPNRKADTMSTPIRECAGGPAYSTARVYRWRAIGMKRLDGFQSPGLAFLSVLLRPRDRFPVGGQNQAGTGVRNFHSVAAGLVDVQKEGLLDGVLMWSRFNVDSAIQKNVRRTQDILTAVHRVGEMMKAAARPRVVGSVRKIVTLVADRQPHAALRAVVQNDLLRQLTA